jgi:hypothetical protein
MRNGSSVNIFRIYSIELLVIGEIF